MRLHSASMTTSLFNCRMESELIDAITEAAERCKKSKSAWAREVLAAAAAEVNEQPTRPHPERYEQQVQAKARRAERPRGCLHPALHRTAHADVCTACGVTVSRRA